MLVLLPTESKCLKELTLEMKAPQTNCSECWIWNVSKTAKRKLVVCLVSYWKNEKKEDTFNVFFCKNVRNLKMELYSVKDTFCFEGVEQTELFSTSWQVLLYLKIHCTLVISWSREIFLSFCTLVGSSDFIPKKSKSKYLSCNQNSTA